MDVEKYPVALSPFQLPLLASQIWRRISLEKNRFCQSLDHVIGKGRLVQIFQDPCFSPLFT